MQKMWAKKRGFTVVELLVVIVIISILTALTAAIYSGIQTRSHNSKAENDIITVQKLVESYKARNGAYPITATSLNVDWSQATTRTDLNCAGGTRTTDWVPGLSSTLPQSNPTTQGVGGYPGCYMYVSDGTSYVLSAWNMIKDPQNTTLYRRLGFREMAPAYLPLQFYICNHTTIGGASGTYNATLDYYKHSYTVSNVTGCSETPPSGA